MASTPKPSHYQAQLLLALLDNAYVSLERDRLPMIFSANGVYKFDVSVRFQTLEILHRREWVRMSRGARLSSQGTRLYITRAGQTALESLLRREPGTLQTEAKS